ncbi:MAG: helix-turn-helix domain-containing protein [Phycicoccus sp.]
MSRRERIMRSTSSPPERPQRDHPLWSVDAASVWLGVPVATLYQWRTRRLGPRAYRVGRHLRYDPADVRAWLDGQAS